MIQNFPKHVVIVPRGFSCWLQSSSLCSQLQRNSPLRCNLTQIDWFLEEAYFYHSLSFQALPQPQTCRVSQPAPEEGPVLPRQGTVSARDGSHSSVPHSVFRSDVFLRKGLKDSLRRLFLSDPRCHIGSSWSGYPRRAGLHPVSARWVTESSAHIYKLNLRDCFHPKGRSYSSVPEPAVTTGTKFSAQRWTGLPDRQTSWGAPSPSRPVSIQTRLERECDALMSSRWSDIFKNRPQWHSWIWIVGVLGKRCLLSLSYPAFDPVALNKWG